MHKSNKVNNMSNKQARVGTKLKEERHLRYRSHPICCELLLSERSAAASVVFLLLTAGLDSYTARPERNIGITMKGEAKASYCSF